MANAFVASDSMANSNLERASDARADLRQEEVIEQSRFKGLWLETVQELEQFERIS